MMMDNRTQKEKDDDDFIYQMEMKHNNEYNIQEQAAIDMENEEEEDNEGEDSEGEDGNEYYTENEDDYREPPTEEEEAALRAEIESTKTDDDKASDKLFRDLGLL